MNTESQAGKQSSEIWRKAMLSVALGAGLCMPAHAVTKPTDMVQVVTWTGGPSEENMVEKRYAKAWKDLTLDNSTRQKILKAERELEAETGEKFRVYALRVTPRATGGGSVIWNVLFISQFWMAAYSLEKGKYCSFNLTGNGSMVSGTQCDWL